MVFTYIAVDKLDKRGLFVWLSLRRRILKEKKLGIDMQPHFSELRDEDQTFFSTDPDPTQLKKIPTTDPTWNRNEEKNIFIC